VQQPRYPHHIFGVEAFAAIARTATRMLDNVLDITVWPLTAQLDEANAKRRVGLGFTGLGDALAMLNLRYDTPAARDAAQHIARTMRDAAYDASADLAVGYGQARVTGTIEGDATLNGDGGVVVGGETIAAEECTLEGDLLHEAPGPGLGIVIDEDSLRHHRL